jgi:hypothetical protein
LVTLIRAPATIAPDWSVAPWIVASWARITPGASTQKSHIQTLMIAAPQLHPVKKVLRCHRNVNKIEGSARYSDCCMD